VPPTTVPPTTVPPTTVLPADVFDPACVVRSTGTSFEEVTADTDSTSDDASVGDALGGLALWIESGFSSGIAAGDLVDICVGNGLNDLDGSPNPQPDDAAIAAARQTNVERQQGKLNELFADFGASDLAVDGDSGARTGQRLCAARLALGLEISVDDMEPGSAEESLLFAATQLPVPTPDTGESGRWILVDRTCQMLFAGTGSTLTFAFTTSTGSTDFETRLQSGAEAFRFNPAVQNNGWHDSSEFPVGVDNPRNGNMYKPLYFDVGQAIHGANYVPAFPDSKGCARLRVGDQDALVGWLGLSDAPGETWRKAEMDVEVTVQGEFIGR